MGFILGKYGFGGPAKAKYILRPLVKCLFALCCLRAGLARQHLGTATGRLAGMMEGAAIRRKTARAQ